MGFPVHVRKHPYLNTKPHASLLAKYVHSLIAVCKAFNYCSMHSSPPKNNTPNSKNTCTLSPPSSAKNPPSPSFSIENVNTPVVLGLATQSETKLADDEIEREVVLAQYKEEERRERGFRVANIVWQVEKKSLEVETAVGLLINKVLKIQDFVVNVQEPEIVIRDALRRLHEGSLNHLAVCTMIASLNLGQPTPPTQLRQLKEKEKRSRAISLILSKLERKKLKIEQAADRIIVILNIKDWVEELMKEYADGLSVDATVEAFRATLGRDGTHAEPEPYRVLFAQLKDYLIQPFGSTTADHRKFVRTLFSLEDPMEGFREQLIDRLRCWVRCWDSRKKP